MCKWATRSDSVRTPLAPNDRVLQVLWCPVKSRRWDFIGVNSQGGHSPRAGGEIPGENQCTTDLQIRNPKRVQGILPAEGLGVSPNSLIFPQEWGIKGAERGL